MSYHNTVNKVLLPLVFSVIALSLIGYQEADASGTLYASDRSGSLWIVNVGAGTFTPVGNFGPSVPGGPGVSVGGTTEIECVPTSGATCFSQLPDGAFDIEPFDITIPVLTGPSVVDGASFTGLEYVGATLYGTHISAGGGAAPSTLSILTPTTGAFVPIGLTGVGAIAGLAYDTGAGIMYGIAGGPGPASLYTISLITGLATPVGVTTMQAGSLQFGPDGKLYAGGTGPDLGDVFEISTSTATSTFFGSTGSTLGITGLTLIDDDEIIGGEIIPIDQTALLLAGVQSVSMWMIPVVIAGAGIGVFVIMRTRK